MHAPCVQHAARRLGPVAQPPRCLKQTRPQQVSCCVGPAWRPPGPARLTDSGSLTSYSASNSSWSGNLSGCRKWSRAHSSRRLFWWCGGWQGRQRCSRLMREGLCANTTRAPGWPACAARRARARVPAAPAPAHLQRRAGDQQLGLEGPGDELLCGWGVCDNNTNTKVIRVQEGIESEGGY